MAKVVDAVKQAIEMGKNIQKQIQPAMTYSDNYINSFAQLDLINDKLQTTEQLQEKILASAERAGSSYYDMAKAVSQIGMAGDDAFKSNDEMIAFTELVQKSVLMSGGGAKEQQATMQVLSQGMGMGKLQGDDFKTIMTNAPLMAKAISEATGKSMADLKKMTAKGNLTADILKSSMFVTADSINEKFDSLPTTFGDIATEIKNSMLESFGPVVMQISGMLDGEGVEAFVGGIKNAAEVAANMLSVMFNLAVSISNFFSTNWPMIEPILWGIVAALSAYKIPLAGIVLWNGIAALSSGILAGAQLLLASAKAAMTGSTLAATSATAAQTAAQWGLNAAILASPIFWVILIIIALIAVFYLVIAAINRFAGTSISATGMIVGSFLTLGAIIANVFMGLIQIVSGVIEFIYNFFMKIANFISNVFRDPIGSVIMLFSDMADTILQLLQRIAKGLDFVFGSSMAENIQDWRDGITRMGKNASQKYGNGNYKEVVDSVDMDSILKMERFDYSDTYKKGYDWGDNLFGSQDDKKDPNDSFVFKYDPSEQPGVQNPSTILEKIKPSESIEKINKVNEVGSINDTVEVSGEDLATMRELAEMKNIQNFVQMTPSVNVQTGDIRQESDINSIVARIEQVLTEQIVSSAQGVYGT